MNRYLGPNPELTIQQIRDEEPYCFNFAEEVANYLSNLIFEVKLHKGDLRQFLIALLFRRVASAFDAVMLMAERGMYTEGLTARRSLLEAIFVLGAICNKPELVQVYLHNDQHRLRDFLKHIKKAKPAIQTALAPELDSKAVDAQIAQLHASTIHHPYMSTESYAMAAQLHDYYLDYSILSAATHHVAKDVERQIAVDSNGEVNGIYWGPEGKPASALLTPAIDHVLLAARLTENAFGLEKSEQLTKLTEEADKLFESYEKLGSS